MERHWSVRQMVLLLALLGTCGVLADGVLTPSISVLSAVGGLTLRVSLSAGAIVGISCGILLGLFLIQQFGTERISFVFSPVILIWLLTIASVGVYNIATFMPVVFKAISPWYAYQFFARNGFESWVALGDIVLCITGGEAMFADMGHFSRTSIQFSFSCLVYPCVLLSYFGQIAFLTQHPEQATDAFYGSCPPALFWPVFVVASAAAIVASQALITGAFSIIKQSMTLSCFPRSRIVHTSEEHEGQIYIPAVNWSLMVLCIAVTAGFQSATAIGNAYGVTVVMVMMLTTALVSLVMLVSWNLSPILVLPFYLFYTALEGLFFSSTLYKVPNGGWFPLALSACLLFVMYTWHFGTYKKKHYARDHMVGEATLLQLLGSAAAVEGAAIVYSEMEEGTPPLLLHMLANIPAVHRVVVCLTVKQLPVPQLSDEHRMFVAQMSHGGTPIAGLYRAVVFYGYNEFVKHDAAFLELLRDQVATCTGTEAGDVSLHKCQSGFEASLSRRPSLLPQSSLAGMSTGAAESASTGAAAAASQEESEAVGLDRADSAANAERLNSTTWAAMADSGALTGEQAIEDTWNFNQVYFMGRNTVVPAAKSKIATKLLIPVYSAIRNQLSNQALMYQIPQDRLLEVGMVYHVE